MISKFFIDRPVFASVLSILITLAGIVSIATLPIAQFPEITPPTVNITARYPGADAETVAKSLAAPIEQELSGTKDLIYFSSQSSNDGSLRVTATFEIGTDIDLAAVEVQNRVKRAEPRLPQETVRQGISVAKASNDILLVAALTSDDPRYSQLELSNYATIYMVDELKRVPGIGDVTVFGGRDYAMRIWVDPDNLASKRLTVSDVAAAVRDENGLYAAGRIGAPPADGAQLTLPVITRGRLEEAKDFENIILRADRDGTVVRVKDIGRAELGSLSYDFIGRTNGQPSTIILAFLQPGANALEAATALRAKFDEQAKNLPPGVKLNIPFDTTRFISVAVREVVKTFAEAVLLVVAVVFLFLGSWRATLIPLLAVPVAIVGAFTGMLLLGFSINSLTLFGLVLAIGIVVDDAIVVVENVERIMAEEPDLSVRDATVKAMQQVTGPVIAIVLVLSAVFVPVAFLGGLTGEMYRQFAVTIAISVAISGFVALTLSPALCRLLLKRGHHDKFILFRWFDKFFDGITRAYSATVRQSIRLGVLSVMLFGGLLWVTWGLFQKVPSGFIPQEDQGYFIVAVSLPQGSSVERTSAVLKEIEDFLLQQPEVASMTTLGGQDLLAGFSPSSSAGLMFVVLKDWEERKGPGQDVNSMVGKVFGRFMGSKDAFILALNPPPVRGLGFRAGFEMQLQARAGQPLTELADQANAFVGQANALTTEMQGVRGGLNYTLPQLFADLDRTRTKVLGVPVNQVFETLQALLDALYVNDFVKFGRIYRVQLQAEPEFRRTPEDIGRFYVRGSDGEMVPLSGLVSTELRAGPNLVTRFNGFPAVQITGEPVFGKSTGDSIAKMEEMAAKLPDGFGYEWSGSSYQEIKAGNQAPYVIGFGLLVVFLVLAAQYERWTLPLAVLMAVPIGAFGAILAIMLRGLEKDIYFQIGLLTLIGLSAKNAILIVEFCAVLREEGKGIVESAVEAAKLRFRPIIMTSLAFILGVVPLVRASGAGAAGRISIGTGVMGGMLAATFLAIFFVPLFYVIVQWVAEKVSGKKPALEA